MIRLALIGPNLFSKFEMRSFTRSQDTTGVQTLKTLHEADLASLWGALVCHPMLRVYDLLLMYQYVPNLMSITPPATDRKGDAKSRECGGLG